MLQRLCNSFVITSLATIYWIIPVLSSIHGNTPICPPKSPVERTHNYPYVVYEGNKSPKGCFVASRRGPCPRGSVLFAKPQSHLGVCSCECFLSDGILFDDGAVQDYRYCINPVDKSAYVYDKQRASCFKLGAQGPCPFGEVFRVVDVTSYAYYPKCVREDHSNKPHTPMQEDGDEQGKKNHTGCQHNKPTTTEKPIGGNTCPPGTIYSTLLNICTDMSFTGLPPTSSGTTRPPSTGTCPPGTIYSTLLNICTDMSFTGLPPSTATTESPTETGNTGSTCPPGTIYSTLLNICTDMSFTGLPPTSSSGTTRPPSTGKCPPGTIYSTLLNICTDMNFTGLPPSAGTTSRPRGKCPEGTIYSTLLNICTDMNFRGLSTTPTTTGKCPPGTIYSTLFNRCTDMWLRGLEESNRL